MGLCSLGIDEMHVGVYRDVSRLRRVATPVQGTPDSDRLITESLNYRVELYNDGGPDYGAGSTGTV